MKKFLSFFIVVAVVTYFVACSVEMDYNPNYEKPVLKNPYVVSIPQAIDRLNAMFPNSVTATRSRVSEVITLSRKDFGLITRSSTTADAPLIYIVPTDNNGCAVMGADSRMTPLYALLENTTLTAEDFLNIDTRTDNEADDAEIKEFVTSLLYDAAIEDIEHPIVPWDSTPPDPDFDLVPIIKSIDSLTESHETYLATKWRQNKAPYNSNLPDSLNGVAGCVAIAIAQIVYHNRYPLFIGNVSFNWHRISAFEYRNRSNATAINDTLNKIAVANFIKQIAIEVNARPQNGETASNFVDAFNFFANHYLNAIPMMYNEDTIRSMIMNDKPIYIRGENYVTKSGHAWVIDGYRKYEDYAHNLHTNEIYKVDSLCKVYLHCNMGWGGPCDGYYLSQVFNATNTLPPKFIIDSIGDYRYKFNDDSYFDDKFRIIIYNK